jgi:hypothetical protein
MPHLRENQACSSYPTVREYRASSQIAYNHVVTPTRSELVRWVRRYEEAERLDAAEARGRPLSPDQSLTRALELVRLAESLGVLEDRRRTTDEDLAAYETWARLRRAIRG